nr:MAG TPA: hypothetical protein [Caudoviricetes sp.]
MEFQSNFFFYFFSKNPKYPVAHIMIMKCTITMTYIRRWILDII